MGAAYKVCVYVRRIRLSVLGSLALVTVATLVSANQYGIATEASANYGSELTRAEVPVTCVGTGGGFVFNDMWQGVQSNAGWIEVGTSYCDAGNPAAKWVWARYTPALGYYESVIQYNSPSGTHKFKIWNYYTTNWAVYINDSAKAYPINLGAGSSGNSTDVGLEVTDSRIGSTQNATYSSLLKAWSTQPTGAWAYWSGQDACSDTSSHIYPKWIVDSQFRNSLNVSLSQSTC